MEEDTNMEGSAPASSDVHADALPMDVDFEDCSHGSISRARLIDGGETACNADDRGLRAMCIEDSSNASASGPVTLDAVRARSEDTIGATHLDAVAQLQDGDESAVAVPTDEGQKADVTVEEIVLLGLLYILLAVSLGQLDGRSIRGPIQEKVVVRADFFATLKAQRSRTAYNGIDGDGIGGAAAQLGMSRTVAGVYIKRLEDLLYDMMPDVIYFPAPSAVDEWDDLVEGFVQRGSDFPDVACVFDGTIIHTRRPRDHMVSNACFGY
ncbi:unnamed protein product [Phytophthora fragariaefolia]|uniref:Unnamed protein product n=1 Tax=Phytophthora fragariaefolia TaxID=1490495 RepID=A0A9W6XMQ6_9STRA|nr:unnamed protein product [Phytophthora fragariaefolia]